MTDREDTAKSYDEVADEYVAHIYGELRDKLAFHIGNETIHTEEMTGYLRQAGFDVESTRERDPYPDVEHPSRRSYIVARNPAPAR
jgi:hypothetical protein